MNTQSDLRILWAGKQEPHENGGGRPYGLLSGPAFAPQHKPKASGQQDHRGRSLRQTGWTRGPRNSSPSQRGTRHRLRQSAASCPTGCRLCPGRGRRDCFRFRPRRWRCRDRPLWEHSLTPIPHVRCEVRPPASVTGPDCPSRRTI